MRLSTASLATSLVAGISATPLATRATALTCDQNTSDGLIYTSANGKFRIACGVDYQGGDMGYASTTTFQACIDTCASTTGCIDVSYVNGACYMKSTLTTPKTTSGVWTAVSVTATKNDLCINNAFNGTNYIASVGSASFQILCNTDLYGGDLKSVNSPSLQGCMDTCSSTTDCVSVSYVAPVCYMKSTLTAQSGTTSVQSAFNGVAVKAQLAAAAASASAAAAAATVLPTAVTCDKSAYNGKVWTSTSGAQYTIQCGTDYAGGDLSYASTATFGGCIDACESTTGCVDVSYVAPACYMKSSINGAVAASHVWTAKKTANAPSLTILSAYYADKDVTAIARTALIQNGNMVVDTSKLATTLGGDPWQYNTKTIVILYTSGSTTRVFTAADKTGIFTVTSSSFPSSSVIPTYTQPSGSAIKIIAVTYGNGQITTQSVYTALYSAITKSTYFLAGNDFFGVDNLYGITKSAVIFYTRSGGAITALTARENDWKMF